jgi:hypothetical protein
VTALQTIIEIAGEGGGLMIFGKKEDDAWTFQLVKDEADLTGESSLHEDFPVVKTLQEAFDQIVYQWNLLYPICIHPEFATEIYAMKTKKDGKMPYRNAAFAEWMNMCGKSVDKKPAA